MRKFVFLVSITMFEPAVAEPQAVIGDALRQLASGKTVHLESPYGTLPVTFKEDGTLSAKASGALAVYLGATTDRGRWAIEGDRICQKFFKWFHAETHCMRVKQDGRQITWRREDGLTGSATIAANAAPLPGRPVGLGVRPSEIAESPATAASLPLKITEPIGPQQSNAPYEMQAAIVTFAAVIEPTEPKLTAMPALARRPTAADAALTAKPSLPLAMVAASAMSMRDAVAEMVAQRDSYLWCEEGLASDASAGLDRPSLFRSRDKANPDTVALQGAGCFMPTAVLSDIARKMVAGR